MKSTKTVTIPEKEYAGLMAQASFLRSAVYALGGVYEVNFETMINHGRGEMQLEADQGRKTIIVKLIQGPHEAAPDGLQSASGRPKLDLGATRVANEDESPPAAKPEAPSGRIASAAHKILRNADASKAEKAVAASALTQKQGRKRITERPGVETDD